MDIYLFLWIDSHIQRHPRQQEEAKYHTLPHQLVVKIDNHHGSQKKNTLPLVGCKRVSIRSHLTITSRPSINTNRSCQEQ